MTRSESLAIVRRALAGVAPSAILASTNPPGAYPRWSAVAKVRREELAAASRVAEEVRRSAGVLLSVFA